MDMSTTMKHIKEVKMPKQTAVEWLETELKKLPMVNVVEVFKQAKAMEKEQIVDAWKDAEGYNDENAVILAKQYYNETYKGGKNE